MSDAIVNSHFPGIPCMGTRPHVLGVVLTQGQRGEFCAYQGIVPQADTRDKTGRANACAWIAAMGQKLRWQECIMHFPLIKSDQYRA